MATRQLTEPEKAELAALNAEVDRAIQVRRAWLDAKMVECSDLQVGDEIVDLSTGASLGVVSKLYRFHSGRNDLYDTHLHVDYEYETSKNSFDNTSRQPGLCYGKRR